MLYLVFCILFCFFNATATTEIYTYLHTLSRHDALPSEVVGAEREALQERRLEDETEAVLPGLLRAEVGVDAAHHLPGLVAEVGRGAGQDRKSTRLNSSH